MIALTDRPRTEPEILIEEARQRARDRRRRGAALLVVAMLVAAGVWVLITRAGGRVRADAGSPLARLGGAVSPPADAIVFSMAKTDGLDARIEIAYVPATGGPVVALTDAKEKMIASEPTWSPDGSRIAFVMSPLGHLTRYAGDGDIYLMNANGTGIRELTHGPGCLLPRLVPERVTDSVYRRPGAGARDRRHRRLTPARPGRAPRVLRIACMVA
jgi:hypothetical protein